MGLSLTVHTRLAAAFVAALGITRGAIPLSAQTPSDPQPAGGASVAQAAQETPVPESPQTAQKPAPEAPADPQAKPAPSAVTAGWRDGFFVQSDKGDFRLQLGALVHADGRFAAGDDGEVFNDTFLLRRVRPSLRGRFANRFEFMVAPDFAGGTLVLQDAYIDTVFAPSFRIRVGKAKSPYGMERLHSAANLLFYDRALPSSLAPNRDVGVQVLGDIASGRLSYQAALLNGVTDGASADVDTADSKDTVGRLVVRPFAQNTASAMRALGVAIAGSAGRQTGAGALPAFRTPSIQQTYFSYTGAIADGVRIRYSPQLFYYYKAFGGLAEYARSELPVRKGTVRDDIAHDAWQAAASFVLSGEAATETGIRPRANFDFGNGHLGAFQIAARYHALTIDDRAFTLDFATIGSSRKVKAWTAGLNWYLSQFFKYVVNFERTVFKGGSAARRPENAFVFRTQLSF